jgi:hypothetical protein
MKAMKCVTLVGATLIITGVMLSLPAPLVGQGRVSVSDEAAAETPPLGNDNYLACDCWCGPTWAATADAVFLHLSRPDSLVLMEDAAAPARSLNADELDFGFHGGWDVSLMRENSGRGIEFRFLSVDGWDAATTAIVGPPSLVRINNAVPITLPGVTAVSATNNSELLSAEFNLRRQVTDCCTLLAGFRYFELDEHFHSDMDAALVTSTYDTFTRNRLYGAQVGAEATLWSRDRLNVDGFGKIGIYHDSGHQNTTLNTGIATLTAADTSDRAAFMGELAFTGNYRLTDCLSLEATYSLLWLETVVLATDQIPATNFFTAAGTDGGGGAFYHGLLIGLVLRQ